MALIHVLDSDTIDKIAAGEVVERPSSVVKELVENAMDAGATAITVEAKDGGISMIRVTDNGIGMEPGEVRRAFLRHATSKIENAGDLNHILTLGFRGEALSSIAAVSQVEIITKTRENLTGVRLRIEGGVELSFEEIGAPEGTTFIMRNLFYNTPVRRKFLKHAPTEGGYITDLMEHLALSRPDISFRLIIGNQTRFQTSGNGDLKEVIYRIYGREMAGAVIPIRAEGRGIKIQGYLGKPLLVRSNRNFEIYYMNGRFIRSTLIAKALEEGYKQYLMQHKFPFCVLHLTLDPERVDVNVHPTKMDVRFSEAVVVGEFIADAVRDTLKKREMIPEDTLSGPGEKKNQEQKLPSDQTRSAKAPEPFEKKRLQVSRVAEEFSYQPDPKRVEIQDDPEVKIPVPEISTAPSLVREHTEELPEEKMPEEAFYVETRELPSVETSTEEPKPIDEQKPHQMNLFEDRILTKENCPRFRLIGQVFDTYWMFQFEEKLCILDQHAAHEKVKYERFMKHYREKEISSQRLLPPIIVSLTGQEEAMLLECKEHFQRMGFEIEAFGGSEYALRSVPVDLYGCGERELFLEVLDELAEGRTAAKNPAVVEEKIASMSCKAAVKGNHGMQYEEAKALIEELLTLENPYNCPHGRPTMITISKSEMEKKFKRIV